MLSPQNLQGILTNFTFKKFIFVFQCKNIKISYCITNFFLNFLHFFFLFQFLCTLKTLYFALMRVRQAYKPLCSYMCANEREKKGEKIEEKRKEEKAWIFVKQIGQMFKYIYIFFMYFSASQFRQVCTRVFPFKWQLATCNMAAIQSAPTCCMQHVCVFTIQIRITLFIDCNVLSIEFAYNANAQVK